MASSQICVREKGSDICPFHPGHKIVSECEDCRTLVCTKCTTSHHRRHAFRDIECAVNEKVNKMNVHIDKTKQEYIPELIEILKVITRQIKNNDKEYQDEIIKSEQQGERLKAEIEEHTVKTVSRLAFLQRKNSKILERQQAIIEKLQTQLEKRIKECELCIRSYTDIEVYDSELPSDHPVVITNHRSLISTSFTPCTDTGEYIKKAFGDILELKISKPTSIPPGQPASKKHTKIVTQYKLIEQNKPLHESDIPYGIFYNAICPTPDNMAWTRTNADDTKIHLVDNKGTKHRALELDVDFIMVCVDPTTGELYCCCPDDNSIRRINTDTGKTTVMFYTQSDGIPCDIGCLEDDRMVVSTGPEAANIDDAMNKLGLYVYTITGNHLYSYTHIGRFPFLSVCPQTNNIALMSGEQVTVLNDTLQEVYTYKGEEGLDGQFISFTAVFVGENLVVGDLRNKIIHILTAATGKWIKSITIDSMTLVTAIGVHQNGVLLVGCMDPCRLLRINCFE